MQKETSSRPIVVATIIVCALAAFFGIRSYVLKKWGNEIETAKVVTDMIFGNIEPSKGEVELQYDDTPLPRNVTQEELEEALEREKNNLVFIKSFRGYAWRAEIDDFLIPNGNFAMNKFGWNITWEKVISWDGRNILRAPTVNELERQREFHQPKGQIFYLSDNKAKPAYAIGRMEIEVPSQIDKLTFDASEVGKTLSLGKTSITLQECENDYLKLAHDGRKVKGEFHVELAAFDHKGRRIQQNSEDIDLIGDGFTNSDVDDDTSFYMGKYDGRIARLEVYIPQKPISSSITVKASTEPGGYL